MMTRKIAILGSGNVATHLALALYRKGNDIVQVYSRHLHNAEMLADRVGSVAISDLGSLRTDADFYIISVKDDAISLVADRLASVVGDAVVLHTAGSVPLSVLSDRIPRAAVLYPMQSFSKSRLLDFSSVPCFVEASDADTFSAVETLAFSISGKVVAADSEKRKAMHLAAVFACNMVNHCYHLAECILHDAGLDFSLLYPLIAETADKVQSMSPKDAQTGPMVRGDKTVLESQMAMLDDEDMKAIYLAMAHSIHKRHAT